MSKISNTHYIIGGSILGVVVLMLIGGVVWWTQTRTKYARGCETKTFTVNGQSLAPLVQEGSTIKANKFDCSNPQKGDLAVATTPQNDNPIIKRIAAVPGDNFTVKDDGTLLVNGNPVQTPAGESYQATQQTQDMFELYEGELSGYVLLGKPGSLDSGRFGAIRKDSITHIVP